MFKSSLVSRMFLKVTLFFLGLATDVEDEEGGGGGSSVLGFFFRLALVRMPLSIVWVGSRWASWGMSILSGGSGGISEDCA